MPDEQPAEQLQFKSAEYSGVARPCVFCNTPAATYFLYGGNVVCESCAAQRAELRQSAGGGRLGLGFMYGFAAAVAGFLIFIGVTMATGYQLSLISILVGWMVGKGVRRGAGAGGRRYQVMAVILTYVAITSSYIPGHPISLIAPLLFIQADAARGALTGLIIFFGLSQAWRLTRSDAVALTGPFRVEAR